ncbi:hypothetical protein RN001_013178 [Aquatica leii]|uniref:Uncharacterized protein n=1 Tax=Aquatica leii TaxID=1421715 RepID=A0AAN7P2D8_9COLE|nr:hypothetical protein RN001_013178 [Aquatica leii]
MLRFSDRLFYKDWWNSNTGAECLRKWNVLIHDWLYTYIYKDLYENVFPKNKFLSKAVVFVVAALFHEYIVGISVRMFVPITSMLYLIPTVIIPFQNKSDNNPAFNVFVWFGFGFTISTKFTILTIEHFARINCPLNEETFYNYIIPRMFYC